MAAHMDWRKFLTDHPILEPLKKNKERLDVIDNCKNWIAAKDGDLFIWNPHTASILTTNLKYSFLKRDPETESCPHPAFQTLNLSRLPINEVDSIVFSHSGNYLALTSRNELVVVQLPRKYGKHGMYEDGKENIQCTSTAVAERLLLSAGMKLICAQWHPGSIDDSHLTILTSDNYIRTFNIEKPDSSIENIYISSEEDEAPQTSTIILHRALGDNAVAFDFGTVVEVEKKKSEICSRKTEKIRLWPVYVLCGNGDVFQALSSVTLKRSRRPSVQGPLPMYPPAEDNYGSDACAILCLSNNPPMLVLATSEGKLYHCILLGTESNQSGYESCLDESRLFNMTSYSVCVYDVVQLEMTLTSPCQDESLGENDGCLMRLQKDISQPDRYICAHKSGLHAIEVACHADIQKFAKSDDDTDLPRFTTDAQAVVEHILCTSPISKSEAAPPLGTCVIADKLLGNFLLTLTLSLELVTSPLRNSGQGLPPSLLSDQPIKEISSPMKQLHKESFDEHIKKILHRDVTNPMIKTAKGTDLKPEDCLQVLSQTVQVMREQHIQKLERAREEIQKRVALLTVQRQCQEKDLKNSLQTKNKLIDKAETLAEKYQEASDSQEHILHRLETIMKKLHARLPLMTDADKNMLKELKNIEEKVKVFRANIQQLKVKQEYQRKQIQHSQKRSTPSRTQTSKPQQKQLRTLLQNEGDEIAELVQMLNQMKTSADS